MGLAPKKTAKERQEEKLAQKEIDSSLK